MDARFERIDRLYAGVRAVGRFWLWFFFTRVEVRGAAHVPPCGSVLLCINHPNNLIDSLIVATVLSREVHYLATSALFRNPLVARFLGACGAIPVYRREDDAARMEKNRETFAACFAILDRGGLIGIYPEGVTHSEARVQRIKTGAARIALDHASRARTASAPPLALIAVGLTFEARKSFRGGVRVSFGSPLPLGPYVDKYRDDPVRAVDLLTGEIQSAMEAEIVHIGRAEASAHVHSIEALYRGALARELETERGLSRRQIDTFRLSQAIADAVDYFESREPERVERIAAQIDRYRAMLAAAGVSDDAVSARGERRRIRARVRTSSEVSAGLPLFAYGALVNLLPYALPRWLARRTAAKETSYATTRFLASIVAFPLFWALETSIVWRLAGPSWAAAFLVSLPLSGLAAYRYLSDVGRLGRELRLGTLLLTRRQATRRLLAARRALIEEIDRAKGDYLAATRGSTF